MLRKILCLSAALAVTGVIAHGSHGGDHDRDPNRMSWGEMHMEEEHHVSNFDPGAFFHLHDFDNSQTWTREEILNTYGLGPKNTEVTPAQKDAVVQDILAKMDYDKDGAVTFDEFLHFHQLSGQLPDYGYGPGHHGDDEYEYEIHHYEKYHGDDTTEDELTHPEDIEHFRKHELEHEEEARLAELEKLSINVGNIPDKFKHSQRGY